MCPLSPRLHTYTLICFHVGRALLAADVHIAVGLSALGQMHKCCLFCYFRVNGFWCVCHSIWYWFFFLPWLADNFVEWNIFMVGSIPMSCLCNCRSEEQFTGNVGNHGHLLLVVIRIADSLQSTFCHNSLFTAIWSEADPDGRWGTMLSLADLGNAHHIFRHTGLETWRKGH